MTEKSSKEKDVTATEEDRVENPLDRINEYSSSSSSSSISGATGNPINYNLLQPKTINDGLFQEQLLDRKFLSGPKDYREAQIDVPKNTEFSIGTVLLFLMFIVSVLVLSGYGIYKLMG